MAQRPTSMPASKQEKSAPDKDTNKKNVKNNSATSASVKNSTSAEKSVKTDSAVEKLLSAESDLIASDYDIADEAQFDLEFDELRLQEKSEFLDFRRRWSSALLMIMFFIIAFDMLFLIAVGLKWLSFEDEWLVRLIFIGNFVEVLGFAKIVIDFLFREPPQG